MKIKNHPTLMYTWGCLTFLILVLSFVDGSFGFIIPTINQSLSIIGVLALSYLIGGLVCLKGLKYTAFILKRVDYSNPKHNPPCIEEDDIPNVLSIGRLVVRRDVEKNITYLKRNSPEYFERNTRYMVAICRSMGAQILLATEAYSAKAGKSRNLAMPEHNGLLARIAREEQVLFYDFDKDMLKDELHMPDGRHVSQIGSDLKRDLFFAYFLKKDIIPQLLKAVKK